MTYAPAGSGTATFSAPFSPLSDVATVLRERGYALLAPNDVAQLAHSNLTQLNALVGAWEHLVIDGYLKDGGRYRKRRHSCFVQTGAQLNAVPHRAHWQPVQYNALHGGMQRWFEPIEPQTIANAAWQGLIKGIGQLGEVLLSATQMPVTWAIEAHQFRIDTEGGIGRPTPEGAHRDGVTLVAVLLIGRHNIKGGETRIFEADGPNGQRFTLQQPWSLLLLNDERMIHETTPIQPLSDENAHRDTLVLTYRHNGFMGDHIQSN